MAAEVSVQLIGLDKVRAAFTVGGEVARRMESELTGAMTKIVEDLVGRAQRLAPLDEGTLRASGTTKVTHDAAALVGEVGFNTPYALTQHERLDFQHPKGGEAKYLETPLKQRAGRYRELIERAIAKAFA